MPELTDIAPILLQAAHLKVDGKTWAEIGEAVSRDEETVRHWPYKRADEWNKALVIAIDSALGTIESEALIVARAMLRGKSNERGPGARMLLEHTRKLRGELLKVSGGDGGPLTINIEQAEPPADSDEPGD